MASEPIRDPVSDQLLTPKNSAPAFMDLFIETGGTAGIQFAHDKAG